MNSPLEHPAAWSGRELDQQQIATADFAASDIRNIQDQLEHGPGVVLLRGFPVEKYSKSDARIAFQEWCSELGTLLSQNEKGDKLFEVTDAGFGKDDPRTRGPNTNKKLSFHTDRCDVIAFLCWKQARTGGENEIISSMHLHNEIARRRPDLLQVLMQSFPYMRHTVDLGNEQPYCEQPIFSFQDGHFACGFLRVLINRAHADPDLPDLTNEQIQAMDFLEAVADEPEMAFHLHQNPGDILLLNNWVTLHRRTAFEDHPDQTKSAVSFAPSSVCQTAVRSIRDSRPTLGQREREKSGVDSRLLDFLFRD